jgi:hypothetical protein
MIMLKNTYFKTFCLMIGCMGLLACTSDATQSIAAQTQAEVVHPKSKPQDGWIQAAQKHNNSGINLRYRMDGPLAVGQPVTISLEFSGARAADARVHVLPAKTLNISGSSSMQKQGDNYVQALKVGETSAQSISVTPMNEGAHFISLQLIQNGQTSASGIMLRVGQAGQTVESSGQLVTTQSGEKLIVMPAK